MSIAVPAAAALGDDDRFSQALQVANDMTAIAIADDRSRRHLDHHVLAAASVTIRALTVFAPFGLPVPLVREVGKVGLAIGGQQDHTASAAAVTPVWPPPGGILLVAEAEAAVAAVSPPHVNGHAIDKHGSDLPVGGIADSACPE